MSDGRPPPLEQILKPEYKKDETGKIVKKQLSKVEEDPWEETDADIQRRLGEMDATERNLSDLLNKLLKVADDRLRDRNLKVGLIHAMYKQEKNIKEAINNMTPNNRNSWIELINKGNKEEPSKFKQFLDSIGNVVKRMTSRGPNNNNYQLKF